MKDCESSASKSPGHEHTEGVRAVVTKWATEFKAIVQVQRERGFEILG